MPSYGPHGHHHARNPRQIGNRAHIDPASQQLRRHGSHGETDLKNQIASGPQRFIRLRNKAANNIQAVLAGKDRHLRLELLHHVLDLVGLMEAHIRGIGEHKIETAIALHAFQYIAHQEAHAVFQLQSRRVGLGNFERLWREVHAVDLGCGQLCRQRQGNGS